MSEVMLLIWCIRVITPRLFIVNWWPSGLLNGKEEIEAEGRRQKQTLHYHSLKTRDLTGKLLEIMQTDSG